MVTEELSIDFENAARDPLGHEHVEGKLRCLRDEIEFHFDERDRAFKRTPPVVRHIPYAQVDSVSWVKRWFRPAQLILRTRDPSLLEGFPGGELGRVTLDIKRHSRNEASQVAALVDFRKSEADLEATQARLDEARGEGKAGL